MTQINTDLMQSYGLDSKQNTKDQAGASELLQKDFLTLMTEQLKNQDPMKPTDNGEFLGQMAQFSTVSSLSKLQETVSNLAQSLQSGMGLSAVGMIGREALAPGDHITLNEDGAKANGAIDLPVSANKAAITITDPGGNVIRRIDMGNQPSGLREFTWDGKRDDGSEAGHGHYLVKAEFNDGENTQAAETLLYSKIESVSFDKGKPRLNTSSGQSIDLASINSIH